MKYAVEFMTTKGNYRMEFDSKDKAEAIAENPPKHIGTVFCTMTKEI